MQETVTRSQRVKRFSRNVGVLTKEERAIAQLKRLDELESDVYESFVSSTESESGFDDSVSQDQKEKRKKKTKKIRKDKRTSLTKTKLNLQQVLAEGEKKERKWVPNFMTSRAQGSARSNYKLCAICNSISKHACPRCWDRVCSLRCMGYHREFICIHVDINFFN